jgi:hypothetical protein
MAKSELKTRPNEASVEGFLNGIADEQQRTDSFRVLEMMKRVSGEEPVMWGPAIVGFGNKPLKCASGRDLEWPLIGFSPRKANLTLYITDCGFSRYDELLAKLGKHKTSVACLYIKRLSDVDENVLEEIISSSLKHVKSQE